MLAWPVDPAKFAAFLVVMSALAVTPGPANLFAIGAGVGGGMRGALLGVAGMNTATAVWFLAASLGLGALMAAYPWAFQAIAVAGGLYVAWLGARFIWGALRDHAGAAALFSGAGAGAASAFAKGFAVQLGNPKAVLFFTAVLPPFVDPARPIALQLAMLAAATLTMDAIAMSAYGLAGGALSARFAQPGFRRAFAAIVGLLLLGSAVLILRGP